MPANFNTNALSAHCKIPHAAKYLIHLLASYFSHSRLLHGSSRLSANRYIVCRRASASTAIMDLNSIQNKISNLTLYDIKAGVRQVQNGTRLRILLLEYY
jgi:hypothetical protein